MRATANHTCFRKARTPALAAAALFLVIAAPLVADELEAILARSPYQPNERVRLEALCAEADALELPTGVLLSKLTEGTAKGVPAERLYVALETDLQNLVHARELIGPIEGAARILEDAAAWERAGNLLRAGWSDAQLVGVVTACADRPEVFREASLFYIAVVDWGAHEAQALRLTEAAVGSGMDPDSYPQIAVILGQARNRRVSLEEAIEIIAAGLDEGRSLRQIRGLLAR